jgi:hypothetical protein
LAPAWHGSPTRTARRHEFEAVATQQVRYTGKAAPIGPRTRHLLSKAAKIAWGKEKTRYLDPV